MSKHFWNQRYADAQTGWDIGYPNQALIAYVENTQANKDLRILIPGAGKAHEGEYLWSKGYRNLFLMDIAPLAKQHFLDRIPDFPEHQYLLGDFFDLNERFDLILEQTFFCAINPSLRPAYADKMSQLLANNGKLAGVLFNFEKTDGPPFGGSKKEYLGYFEPYFNVLKMDDCYNSIDARQGNEYFFELSLK